MKVKFKDKYKKEEMDYILKRINEIKLDKDDEYFFEGEVSFIATKENDTITVQVINHVL